VYCSSDLYAVFNSTWEKRVCARPKILPPTRFFAYDISIGPQRFVVVIRIRHIPLKDLNNGNYKSER